MRKSLFVFMPFLAIFLWTSVAQAGVFSFFGDLFSGTRVSAESETFIDSTSQSMPLLEAAIAPDPAPKTANDITIVGGEALLPEVGPTNLAPEMMDVNSGQISIYIVRSGDNLAKIADMFDVSVNTIAWANDLTRNSALKVGDSLVILPMTGVMHTVVAGDTLSTIAKKYGGDLNEIANFNDLTVNAKLAIGESVIVPDGEVSSPARTTISSTKTSSKFVGSMGGPEYSGYYKKPFIIGTRTQGLHGYNAVDYGMPIGSPIYAAADGQVIVSKNSGYNGGYGDYIVIKHGNSTQTVYGHLSKALVAVGQSVTQGQLIGYSGNTGNSTGPHLHFEIRGAKNPF